jgi:hypothetical protein
VEKTNELYECLRKEKESGQGTCRMVKIGDRKPIKLGEK